MIRVQRQNEPADFDLKVRTPGSEFLRLTPSPTREQFRRNDYWRECLGQLYAAYNQVCAYSSVWIPTGYSVDHFYPKTRYAALAYEWSNYRLALDFVNNNKGSSEVVLDPFIVQTGWFILDKASLWVHAEPTLDAITKGRVEASIKQLKLNHSKLVNVRFQILRGYIDGKQTLDSIAEKYPFIATEIERQGIKTAVQTQAERAPSGHSTTNHPPQ